MLNAEQQHQYVKCLVQLKDFIIYEKELRQNIKSLQDTIKNLIELDVKQGEDYPGRIITNEDELPPVVTEKLKLKVGDVILYSRSLMPPEKVHGEILSISSNGHIYVTVRSYALSSWIDSSQVLEVLDPQIL